MHSIYVCVYIFVHYIYINCIHSMYPFIYIYIEREREGDRVYACACSVTQSFLILCDHMDCGLPSSSVHGIF